MSALSPFDYLNSITHSKQNLMEDPENIKGYSPFMVNRGLSYHYDTILYANEMNLHSDLDKDQQYFYLLNIIRAKKRFAKWAKPEKSKQLIAIQHVYLCNSRRAVEIAGILTEDQLKLVVDLANLE